MIEVSKELAKRQDDRSYKP